MHYVSYLFLAIIYSACQPSSTTIINKGQSDYNIVLDIDASSKEKEVAQILQQYIYEVSAVKMPIIVGVEEGAKNMVRLSVDSSKSKPFVAYQMDGANLHIEGSDEQYLKYAVYEFLERELSCRFWTPEAEAVPELKKVQIKNEKNYRYSPPVHVRTVHSKLFYEHHEFADKQRVTYEAFPMYAPYARVHTFHRFVPSEKYFKEHPEYYALVDGKRRTTQLCLSNAEVLGLVKEEVANAFKQNPNASVVSVSQDDNTQYCQCKHCATIDEEEGSPSGSMIRFVNAVARDFPDKTISTLAYQYTREACKTKPLDNVLITLCSIECDRSAPIKDVSPDFASDLQGWKQLTKNIRIWDYTTQFTNFLAPFPNIYSLEPNIRFFADNNARWIFEQHSHNPSELFELRSYVMARLLWDPNRNTDVLIREFCGGYYGSAGAKVAEYIGQIHNELAQKSDFFLFLYGGPSQAFDSFLRPEALDNYNAIFDQAEIEVIDNKAFLKRVKRARLGVRYATLEACRANLSNKYSLGNTDFVSKELEAFKQSCKDGGITMMNETRFTVNDYLRLYSGNQKRAGSINLASNKPVKLLAKPRKYANEDPQTLTDNAFGGGSFYASWLGFEGNDMVAIIDLGQDENIEKLSTGFLQVMNHVVFFPQEVNYYLSLDGVHYMKHGKAVNNKPLKKDSKINDTQIFEVSFPKTKARYVKIEAINIKTAPEWHHAVGLPSWIFADEVQVN
ncbi:DUF4838 domain-containing protein [Carboxylicivirga marina]|uniref:DUF4838 domain-containing protein n=1 Tax=Carboxylicivirga marina TaxID=2800988 RepID=A0ABS1HPI4_9BACT|nr:DUF4838 domain-containing protein [Carboxylicivirga marina]MBK3519556.1 DUF4838 domain-containing protein [Carboxylicivirga marina]